MKYYRLLKDAPELPAGSIVKYNIDSHEYESIDRGQVVYWRSVVEDQPGWFEEVVPIYVRPANAEALQQLDSEADGNKVQIGEHFHVRV